MVEVISTVCFHFFFNQVARELAPKSAVIFRQLVRAGSLPTCWRLPDIVPVPKVSAYSDVWRLQAYFYYA